MEKLTFKGIAIYLMMALCIGFASCGGDDDGNGGSSSGDPEGTVLVNILLGRNDKGIYQIFTFNELKNYPYIFMHEDNNFHISGGNIVSLGPVSGLSAIKKLPTNGWVEVTAVIPGYGYIYRTEYDQYVRIYVVDYMESTYGGIMGCTIKYQAPWLANEGYEIK